MKLEFKRWFWGVVVVIVALGIISSMIAMFSMIELLTSFKILFGGAYMLFLPGFILSYIFLSKTKNPKEKSKKKGTLTWLERIALSIGISILLVPVVVFYLGLIGVEINVLNSFLTTSGIIVLCVGILIYELWKRKK